MKKTLAILLAAVMVLCLFAGCSETDKPADGGRKEKISIDF